MRRDTEIGIIAGIVLAIVIGVFISTRPGVKETTIPLLSSYEVKIVGEEAPDHEVSTQQPLHEIAGLPEEVPGGVASTEHTVQMDEGEAFEDEWDEEIIEGEWEEEFGEEEWEEGVVEGEWDEEVSEEELDVEVVKGELKQEALPPTPVVEEKELAPEPVPAKVEERPIYPQNDIVYKVKSGDTLAKLAKRYYGDAKKWNIIYNANTGKIAHRNALYIGQKIVIPAYKGTGGEEVIAGQVSTPSSQEVPASLVTGKRTHTVQSGDTLYRLSRQYYNNDAGWKKIYDANRDVIPNKNAILRGTVLIIPE